MLNSIGYGISHTLKLWVGFGPGSGFRFGSGMRLVVNYSSSLPTRFGSASYWLGLGTYVKSTTDLGSRRALESRGEDPCLAILDVLLVVEPVSNVISTVTV